MTRRRHVSKRGVLKGAIAAAVTAHLPLRAELAPSGFDAVRLPGMEVLTDSRRPMRINELVAGHGLDPALRSFLIAELAALA